MRRIRRAALPLLAFGLACAMPSAVEAEAQDPRLVEIVELVRAGQAAEALLRADAMIAGFEKDKSDPATAYFCNRDPLGEDRGGIANLVEGLKAGRQVDLAPEAWCEALFMKSFALKRLGRLPEAEAAALRAVAMDPSNPHFLNQLGDLELAQDKPELALLRYGAAHALAARSPEDALVRGMDGRALRGMGAAARAKGDLAAAQEHYMAALAIDAADAEARTALAEVVKQRAAP